jgi:hypothetical protein
MMKRSFAGSVTARCGWRTDMSREDRRSRIVLAAWFVISQACCVAGGQEPAYSITCRVELASDPALTAALRDEIKQRVARTFEVVLTDAHRLRFLAPDHTALPGGPPSELVASAVSEKWTSGERLMLVYVRRQSGSFVVEAREFDPLFQVLGAVSELRTVQRELVADTAARAALAAFAPTAEVRSAIGNHVSIEFWGGRQLREFRSWVGLEGDMGLQVLREPIGATGDAQRPTRFRRTFLSLRQWESDAAECELVGPDTNMFRDLGLPSVRYLARPVRAARSAVSVRVLRKDGRGPQEGCEVFASPRHYSTDTDLARGLTDRDGRLRLELNSAAVQFVTVRYEDLLMKAPVLAGASADPVVFEMSTRGRRAEFVLALRQLRQDIYDQALVDSRLAQDLKAKAEAKDIAEVLKLVERGRRKRLTHEQVVEQASEIESRAAAEGENVSALASAVRKYSEQAAAPNLEKSLAAYGDWADRFQKETAISELCKRIHALRDEMDWEGLVPLYEQLVALAPERGADAEQLRRLRNNLRTKGAEHADAKAFVAGPMRTITPRDLGDRWAEIERAADALLKAEDHLTLLKLNRSLSGWARDIGNQVKGLVEQIQAAGKDDDRIREIQATLDELQVTHGSLQKLNTQVQNFLKDLEL